MKILFIPGFGLGNDNNLLKINNDIDSLKDYSDLNSDLLDRYKKIIAHSTGCLYLAEFIVQNDLLEKFNNRIILYNPIIESSKSKLFFKNFERKEIYLTPKGSKILFNFFKNNIFSFGKLFKQYKKIIETTSDYKIDLYNKFENIFLSKKDQFSKEYFKEIKNAKDIGGNHDEIYFDEGILKQLITYNF